MIIQWLKFILKNYRTVLISFCLSLFISCKTSYTHIGDKDANYIPYYLKVYEADSLFITRNYFESYQILDQLFKEYEPINMEVYREFETYLAVSYLSGNDKQLNKKLKKSFTMYGTTYDILKNDATFFKIFENSKFEKQDLINFSKKYKQNLNLVLRDSIENMVNRDYEVREKKNRSDEELGLINEKNSKALKSIFEKYGYPSVKIIGYYHLNQKPINLDPVFLHCTQPFIEGYLLSKLKEYAKKGECNPDLYAARLDKSLISYGSGKQLYGTFNKNDSELMPLKQPNKLDSLRKSLGLAHIGYQKWRLKAKYKYKY